MSFRVMYGLSLMSVINLSAVFSWVVSWAVSWAVSWTRKLSHDQELPCVHVLTDLYEYLIKFLHVFIGLINRISQ